MKIDGGYYIKARQIQESTIQRKPPYVREIWDWLLMKANHSDKKYKGYEVKRGQLFRTYRDIREGLAWSVGYRKEMYSDNQMKKAMKTLREELMIDSTKELGGVLITILNYDLYQDPKNYERTNERTNERTKVEPCCNRGGTDNNKNVKNEKKKNIEYPEWLNLNLWLEYKKHRSEIKKKLTPSSEKKAMLKLKGFIDEGYSQDQIINDSIAGGWQGLFRPNKRDVKKLGSQAPKNICKDCGREVKGTFFDGRCKPCDDEYINGGQPRDIKGLIGETFKGMD